MGLLGLLYITPGCGEFEFPSEDLYIIAEKVFSPAGKTQARFSPPKVACLEVIRTTLIIIIIIIITLIRRRRRRIKNNTSNTTNNTTQHNNTYTIENL